MYFTDAAMFIFSKVTFKKRMGKNLGKAKNRTYLFQITSITQINICQHMENKMSNIF